MKNIGNFNIAIINKNVNSPKKRVKKLSSKKQNFQISNKFDNEMKKNKKILNEINDYQEEVIFEHIGDINKKSEYGKMNYKYRIVEICISILMICNTFLSIAENEVYVNESNKYISDYMKINNISYIDENVLSIMANRQISKSENTIRYINGGIILITCILIYYSFIISIEIEILNKKLNAGTNIFNSGMLLHFSIEILICIIYIPPFINHVFVGFYLGYYWSYSLNSIISFAVLLKFYFVLRILNILSKWNSDVAQSIANKYNINTGIIFAIKCQFKNMPILFLIIVFSIIFLLLSFLVKTFEFGVKSPKDTVFIGNNDFQNLTDCFNFIVFSMLTVGYGTNEPRSLLGRSIAIITVIVGNLIIALLIASLAVIFEFTTNEKKSFLMLKKITADDNCYFKASKIILKVFELRIYQEKILKAKNSSSNFLKSPKITDKNNFKRSNLNQSILFKNGDKISNTFKKLKNKEDNNVEVIIDRITQKFLLITELKRNIYVFINDFNTATSFELPLDENIKYIDSYIKKSVGVIEILSDELQKSILDTHCINNDVKYFSIKMKNIVMMQDKISSYIINLNNSSFNSKNNKILHPYE